MHRDSARRLWPAALVLLLTTACTSTGDGGTARGGSPAPSETTSPSAAPSTSPSAPTPAGPPRPGHVVVAIFENKESGQVLGSGRAPWFDALAASGALLADSHAVTHPSQPNYIALFSGSTHGVTDDSCPQELSGDTLAGRLMAAGRTFAGYSEDLPAAGFTGCLSDQYRRKHNPWVDFPALPASVNQPLSAMPTDFARLPTVSFVVPDLCHDMHNCDVPTGDAWAREHLDPYVRWAKDHDSLLIVTFDEDDGSTDNHIATIVAGAGVRPGPSDQRVDHYSVLRTLLQMYGLPPIGEAARAAPITGIWSTGE